MCLYYVKFENVDVFAIWEFENLGTFEHLGTFWKMFQNVGKVWKK